MKLLSFAVPCYNSEAYMEQAINTLVSGGDQVEIILVNDGSTDRTSEIAKAYEAKYPNIIRAIDQENGGHGDAVNTGLKAASGKYFKVVDSDDWIDSAAYKKILEAIEKFEKKGQDVDLILANYVYEKAGVKKKRVIHYREVLPQNEIFSWDEIGRFRIGQYILMHSAIYRTQLLKGCGLTLPKHTFYVDNIYVYYPLPYVKSIYYMDENFYRYFIGREDQSVNEKVMIGRVDQQIFVTKMMIDMYNLKQVAPKKLSHYMINYLAIMMTVSSILLIRSKSEENLKKKKELWNYLKKKDFRIYFKIRYGILGQTMNLPGESGRKISTLAYKMAQKIVGFN